MIFQDELFLLALLCAFLGGAYHAWRTTPLPEKPFARLRPNFAGHRKRPV